MSRRGAGAAAATAFLRSRALPAAAVALALAAGCGPRAPLPASEAYDRYCARCHGDDGRGDPKAVRLNPRLDLVRSLMVAEGEAELVRERIAEGRGAMPGFERKLAPGEIAGLTAYTLERFGNGGG
ncbi:MAG TPA: cytochrome c [Thermoanaerobaculia bacterium]|nr:cytochrome c [Thermoanaerobaculia bacterium]